ncbi:MAG: selenide, water dikinase SelD [Bacteroidales bacterium]
MKNEFDLLTTVEYGGCSAKLSPKELSNLLQDIPILKDNRILVDIETHDDAGVFLINDSTALIVTTDFFPPVCSRAEDFGEIAAANSLSDVYAMGGTPLLTLNLTMFPSKEIPLEVLKEILLGGQSKINEAGAFTMGGHTIDDYPPKYGLAVVGTVHPDHLITNSGLREGQKLILTKPLGMGVIIAARRMGMASDAAYEAALTQMKLLNKKGAELMQKYHVTGATDVTGFGLAGHLFKMALASGVTAQVYAEQLPLLPEVRELLEEGCIPGGAFRNLDYAQEYVHFAAGVPMELKMAACDPQTSGGLLMGVDADLADALLEELHQSGLHPDAAIIGEILPQRNKSLYLL